jgi:hypothetical protein
MSASSRAIFFSLWGLNALLSGSAAAFPLGLGYEVNQFKVELEENIKRKEPGKFTFNASYHSIGLLDYTGILCAGFQNVHSQMEAHDKAVERAQYDTTKKPGDKITYTWKAVMPVQGTACGVRFHRATSDEKAEMGGTLPKSKTLHGASLAGWTAFGIVTAPFEGAPDYFWKLHLMVDVRDVIIKGIPGTEDFKETVLAMPFDYELGRIINIESIGGFMVWVSAGYDMFMWIMKALTPEYFPSSFVRLGAGVGYQTPIDRLQIRLAYKKTDTAVSSRQLLESGYTLGIYYQM